jgi:hypothetical protein
MRQILRAFQLDFDGGLGGKADKNTAQCRPGWGDRPSHEVVSAPDLAVASSPRPISSTCLGLKVELAAKPGANLSASGQIELTTGEDPRFVAMWLASFRGESDTSRSVAD